MPVPLSTNSPHDVTWNLDGSHAILEEDAALPPNRRHRASTTFSSPALQRNEQQDAAAFAVSSSGSNTDIDKRKSLPPARTLTIPFSPSQPGGFPKRAARIGRAFSLFGASAGRNFLKLPFSPVVGAIQGGVGGCRIGQTLTTRTSSFPVGFIKDDTRNWAIINGRFYPPYSNEVINISVPYGPKIIGIPLSLVGKGLGATTGASAGAVLMPSLVMSKPFRRIPHYFSGIKTTGQYCSDGSISVHNDATQFHDVVMAAHSTESNRTQPCDDVFVKVKPSNELEEYIRKNNGQTIIKTIPGDHFNYINVTELFNAVKSQQNYTIKIHKFDNPESLSAQDFVDGSVNDFSMNRYHKEFLLYFKNPDVLPNDSLPIRLMHTHTTSCVS